jgi:hypothetical protein
MITIVRAADGTIKTFSERANNDYNQVLGETIEHLDTTMEEYASRFKVSCQGKSGETIQVGALSGDRLVQIATGTDQPIGVSVNGIIETLTPANGFCFVTLGTEVPGIFIIEPADRRLYCAAGEGRLVVEVLP